MGKQFLVYLLLFILSSSCSEETPNKAIQQIKSMYGAQRCTITFDKHFDDDRLNQIQLTITNPDDKQFLANIILITSASSMILYQSLTPEEIKTYHKINVTIEHNSSVVSKEYSMSELEAAKKALILIKQFINLQNEKKFSSAKELVDSTEVSKAELNEISNGMLYIDSTYGKIKNIASIGFAFGELGKSEQITVVWMDVQNGNAITHYTYYVSNKNKKIIFVDINNQKNSAPPTN